MRTYQGNSAGRGAIKAGHSQKRKSKAVLTASDVVYNIIKRSKKGLKISDIKSKTDFEDKKLRNILFRLHSLGRIKRVSRGIYISA